MGALEDRKDEPCPCGSGDTLGGCCGPYITRAAAAPTAESLMRSRYTAYVLGEIDWIFGSHDPAGADEVDRASTEKWSKEARWKGLEIKSKAQGQAGDQTGTVEFVATYELGNQTVAHHELARFKKIEDRWYYVDGDMVKPRPIVRESPKVGRNDPCPCGSGQKYKKCHGAAA
jgi:SEC-C motif-containing protein